MTTRAVIVGTLEAMNQVPKPLSELREDVPPGLERVVARCLAKEPDVRYAQPLLGRGHHQELAR